MKDFVLGSPFRAGDTSFCIQLNEGAYLLEDCLVRTTAGRDAGAGRTIKIAAFAVLVEAVYKVWVIIQLLYITTDKCCNVLIPALYLCHLL